MADTQSLIKTASGIYSQFNKLNSLPPGALLQCLNGVIDRDGVIGKRRGVNRYGQELSTGALNLFEYQKTLVVLDGTTLKHDSNGSGTWTSWTGTFSPPDSNTRMHALESNKNFYFTTSNGIYKNDTLSGTPAPTMAGMPEGLDIIISTGAEVSFNHWMDDDTRIAYRVVFQRIDENNNTIVGAPSRAEPYSNSSGVAIYPSLSIVIPSGIVTGDYLVVYRTMMSASASTEPADRYYQIWKYKFLSAPTPGDLYEFDDVRDESFLGDELYTDDLLETISQKNDRPPFAKSMAQYKGHIFFGNIRREQEKAIKLADIDPITDDLDTITITSGATVLTYTYSTAESVANHKFKRTDSADPLLLGADIAATAKSLCHIINSDTTNTLVYARYTSGVDDDPGRIRLTRRDYSTTEFHVNATATGGTTEGINWDPILPVSGTTEKSSQSQDDSHLIARSKFQQPEAVPFFNTMEIGRADQAILGMATLKHGILIWKEDGIFLISGETDGGGGFNFVIDEIDPTIKLQAPASLVTLDNAVMGYTSQGVVRAYEGGTGILSRQIEKDFNPIAQGTRFSSISHAVAYESDRKYLFFTPESTSDLVPKICWVYNYLTNAWTKWGLSISCGIVLSSNQTLYLGHATEKWVLKERKSYLDTNEDFMDETLDGTVYFTGRTLYNDEEVSYIALDFDHPNRALTTGFLFEYNNTMEAKVVECQNVWYNSYLITLDTLLPIPENPPTPAVPPWITAVTPFTVQLSAPIDLFVEWAPETAGSVSAMKQFSYVQIYQEQDFALSNEVGFFADTQEAREFVSTVNIERTRGWGLSPWGEGPWGDDQEGKSTPIRVPIPRNHQRCRALRIYYRHRVAKETVNILQLSIDVRNYGMRTQLEPR